MSLRGALFATKQSRRRGRLLTCTCSAGASVAPLALGLPLGLWPQGQRWPRTKGNDTREGVLRHPLREGCRPHRPPCSGEGTHPIFSCDWRLCLLRTRAKTAGSGRCLRQCGGVCEEGHGPLSAPHTSFESPFACLQCGQYMTRAFAAISEMLRSVSASSWRGCEAR